MRHVLFFVLFAFAAAADMMMIPRLGSPSFAAPPLELKRNATGFPLSFDVRLPPGIRAYTIAFFIRQQHNPTNHYGMVSIQSMYSWDTLTHTYTNAFLDIPRLPLDAAGKWKSGDILANPRDCSDDPASSLAFQRGVWWVAVSNSAPCTVTVAGHVLTLATATNICVTLDGKNADRFITVQTVPGAAVALKVGIATVYKFYGRNNILEVCHAGIASFDPESMITNTFVHCSFRVALDPAARTHRYNSEMLHANGDLPSRRTESWDYPPRGDAIVGRETFFRVMSMQLHPAMVPNGFEIYDFRFFPVWLSDNDISTLRTGGFRELAKRGIPPASQPKPKP